MSPFFHVSNLNHCLFPSSATMTPPLPTRQKRSKVSGPTSPPIINHSPSLPPRNPSLARLTQTLAIHHAYQTLSRASFLRKRTPNPNPQSSPDCPRKSRLTSANGYLPYMVIHMDFASEPLQPCSKFDRLGHRVWNEDVGERWWWHSACFREWKGNAGDRAHWREWFIDECQYAAGQVSGQSPEDWGGKRFEIVREKLENGEGRVDGALLWVCKRVSFRLLLR